METTVATQKLAIQSLDRQSIEMELLDRYGISEFVDAIEASRFDRAFRKHSNVSLRDDLFWDDVRMKLNHSASA